MAIQYSGNAQTSIFATTTKQDIINGAGAALLAAGWTTVSGGTGTAAWKLQSATTPQGYAIRVLMQDNGGSCITFSLESSDGTVVGPNSTTQGGAFLLPGQTYRFTGSKYQGFICAVPDSGISRTVALFGVPYVPAWNVGSISRAAWMQGNAATDADATRRQCLRSSFATTNALQVYGAQQALFNSAIWSMNSTSAQTPVGQIVLQNFFTFIANAAQQAISYVNGSTLILDALIFWGLTGSTATAQCPGQLWDSFVMPMAIAGDETASAPDGHNYISFSNNANGSAGLIGGTLFLATS